MNYDDQPIPSSAFRKPNWSAAPLLAVGFIAGCFAARTRATRMGLLAAAGGLAWELIRPRSHAPMLPQTSKILDDDVVFNAVTEHFANMNQDDGESCVVLAHDAVFKAVTEHFAKVERVSIEAHELVAAMDENEPQSINFADSDEVLSQENVAAAAATTVPMISSVWAHLRQRLDDGETLAKLEPVKVASVEVPDDQAQAKLIHPLANIELANALLTAEVLTSVGSAMMSAVSAEANPADQTTVDVDELMMSSDATLLPSDEGAKALSEPLEVPILAHAEAVALPFHLDKGSSAAWLLGLEPIPLVQEEPEWRRPLLAGIQSAFALPVSTPGLLKYNSIAEGAAIPDAVEITATEQDEPAAATSELVAKKPPTRGLLGKLFESPATMVVPKSTTRPLITPRAEYGELKTELSDLLSNDQRTEPATVLTRPPFVSELREHRRRAPALVQMNSSANASATALAAGTPVRRTPMTTNDGAKKKSWLGLWK